MNISENHNTSIGKYGDELTKLMEKNGIGPKYLLSACRFHIDNHVPILTLALLFKQWNTYVMKNRPIDVNTLTYDEFRRTLSKYKKEFGIPNKVYDDGQVSIGEIQSNKDIERFPVKNNWCIKYPREYAKYTSQGYRFFLIDNGDESDYVRYAILMVGKRGEQCYYDLDNSQLTDRSVNEFQSHLTQKALSFIQSISTNNNMKKNVVKINEGALRKIVAESVKKVIENIDISTLPWANNPYEYVDNCRKMDAGLVQKLSGWDEWADNPYHINEKLLDNGTITILSQSEFESLLNKNDFHTKPFIGRKFTYYAKNNRYDALFAYSEEGDVHFFFGH